jgi:hypothetical protein
MCRRHHYMYGCHHSHVLAAARGGGALTAALSLHSERMARVGCDGVSSSVIFTANGVQKGCRFVGGPQVIIYAFLSSRPSYSYELTSEILELGLVINGRFERPSDQGCMIAVLLDCVHLDDVGIDGGLARGMKIQRLSCLCVGSCSLVPHATSLDLPHQHGSLIELASGRHISSGQCDCSLGIFCQYGTVASVTSLSSITTTSF